MKYFLFFGTLAVIVGFSYWSLFSVSTEEQKMLDNNGAQLEEQNNTDPVSATKKEFSGTGTLESLRLLGDDVECTIAYVLEDGEQPAEGTFFASEGKIRGDFLVPSPDLVGQNLSSMILDGQTMYTWTEIDGEAYGVKINLTDFVNNGVDTYEPVSMDAEVSYECKPWLTVDDSVFVPPTDVLFQDMSLLLKSGMEYGTVYEEGEF